MPEILLSTLNARYAHSALGLRYLLANLGGLGPRAAIREFEITRRPVDVAETILRDRPRILGLGVYVWNVTPTTELVAMLKRLDPQLTIVLGGPEVSHETDAQEIVRLADYVVTGEADLAFAELCRRLLSGERPAQKVIAAELPDLAAIELPYDLYDADDIAHRVLYVEASRGCPFSCEFCLSSLDVPLRAFPLEQFLAAMQRLIDRGARHFKFVDRTFNLRLDTSLAIVEFFRGQQVADLSLHFEMIPDRMPPELGRALATFPTGAVQLEVGIQSFNEEVTARISRRQDNAMAERNLRWLRQSTGVHLHTDLIVGLPGESLASFTAGFDRLVGLGPQEIQVGLLKRLRGTPISRHDADFGMVYSPHPPYEILANSLLDFATMQRLRRFARYWDLLANSGRFIATLPLLWSMPGSPAASPFAAFLALTDWVHARTGQTHAIALARLRALLGEYLVQTLGRPAEVIHDALERDARRCEQSARTQRSGEAKDNSGATVAGGRARQARAVDFDRG
ncbi:MAG: B12-binding domain-containing radical SAM protein [Phycisphaeraceae bacterium]|nr:B12-binding domain-containing radical SAM protein [Phycisphaeraceae bacterium]